MNIFKITILLGILLTTNTANAESFAEKFRKFVLGSEAEAHTIAENNRESVRVDGLSQKCLNCHNGSRAIHIEVKDATTPLQIRGHQTVNHPVGMSYRFYADLNPREYTPISVLENTNIRFVNGKVSCVSCHRLKQDVPEEIDQIQAAWNTIKECSASRELTIGPTTLDLCISCHYSKY